MRFWLLINGKLVERTNYIHSFFYAVEIEQHEKKGNTSYALGKTPQGHPLST